MCDKCKDPNCKGVDSLMEQITNTPSGKRMIVTALASEITKILHIGGLPIHPATIAALRLVARMMELKEFTNIDPATLTPEQTKAANDRLSHEMDFILADVDMRAVSHDGSPDFTIPSDGKTH